MADIKVAAGELDPDAKQLFVNTPDAIPRFYANNVEITFSTWDMHMTFSEILAAHSDKQLLQRTARVTMSLEHAKVFVELLVKSLGKFEEAVGRPIEQFVLDLEKLKETPEQSKGEPAAEG